MELAAAAKDDIQGVFQYSMTICFSGSLVQAQKLIPDTHEGTPRSRFLKLANDQYAHMPQSTQTKSVRIVMMDETIASGESLSAPSPAIV